MTRRATNTRNVTVVAGFSSLDRTVTAMTDNRPDAMTLPAAVAGGYQGTAKLPAYDRSAVTAGIVHLGVGSFHRSHQAVYLDRLLAGGAANDWGIRGVGILENDRRMRDILSAQDHLFTVLQKSPDGTIEARVVGSMVGYQLVEDDPQRAIDMMAAPSTRIVTLTITEGGYNLEPATQQFDESNPAVLADLAGEGLPRTHFRLIVEALKRRRHRNIVPFTVASCDNIQGNGDMARRTLLRYAELDDPDMAKWIAQNVRFPNSMVDRITPITAEEDLALVATDFGLRDSWPVPCESFTQWVLEDDFSYGRPALEDVGVQFVASVIPYELMKLRLLNASHQLIGAFGFLAGHRYVHQAITDPLIHKAVTQFQAVEAEPTLLPVPGIDLQQYRRTLVERFANPAIKDTIARMCLQTSTMIPNFVLPVIRDQLAAGGAIKRATATVAAWACRAEENGDYTIVDRRRHSLVARAKDLTNPYAFIEDEELFGDLTHNDRFRSEFRAQRQSIRGQGIHAALAELVKTAL